MTTSTDKPRTKRLSNADFKALIGELEAVYYNHPDVWHHDDDAEGSCSWSRQGYRILEALHAAREAGNL